MNKCKTVRLWTYTCISALLISTRIFAMPPDLILVFDRVGDEAKVTKKYRSITDLRASASGQFSADELPKILRAIPESRQDVWIVDLRQESHGFIDGLPVSWTTNQNAANANLTPAQIQRIETKLLREISKQKTITVFNLKKLNNGHMKTENPVTMLPETVETEQQLVASLGANYARIYVLDHNKPDDIEVDNFVYFIKHKIKSRDWVHFHCRGGVGRSSTFLAMYDIIRNAKNSTFVQIMHRQANMGNKKLNELTMHPDKEWIYIFL